VKVKAKASLYLYRGAFCCRAKIPSYILVAALYQGAFDYLCAELKIIEVYVAVKLYPRE